MGCSAVLNDESTILESESVEGILHGVTHGFTLTLSLGVLKKLFQ
jgi:hypothetical protein